MDQEWVLDSLIGFLRGPLWSEPVFTFLDERSVVFDVDDTPDNQEEYRKIYKDYKQLVNETLDSHMRELSISPKQFEQAVEDANEFLSERLQHTLFEQIWAADHFDSFKRMMIQVNIDLQLWALEILAAKYGIIPALFVPEGCTVEDFISDDDSGDYQFISSRLRSMVNFSNADGIKRLGDTQNGQPSEHREEERDISATSVNTCVSHESREKSDLQEKTDTEVQEIKKEKTLPPLREREEVERPLSAVTDAAGDKQYEEALASLLDVEIERPKTALLRQSEVKTIRSRLNDEKETLDAEEIRKRQTYLRSQRDRLLKLKKEEREQQVKRMQELQQSGQRPPTAKFIALEKEKQKEDERDDSGPDRALAYMRSLAARIKSEVSDPEAQ